MTTAAAPTSKIPLVDLAAQHAEVAAEVAEGFERVLSTTGFIGGPAVADFESELAGWWGRDHAVGVANGTDALELMLRAAGVGSGDEVIVPANSFIATASAVVRAGARPVFVDVDPTYLLIDPIEVERALTSHTRAVIAVHLFGQLAPVEALGELLADRHVLLLEDAAQCHGALRNGAPAGTVGLAAATSFYPGKNLGAYGDGGAVLTDRDELARRVRLLGAHGATGKYDHEELGFNSRLDALQAVVLSAKLRRMDEWNAARRTAAATYHALLSSLPDLWLPEVMPGNVPVWHLYALRVAGRDRLLAHLQAHGVGAGIHYPVPIHLQGAFRAHGHRPGDFPNAEQAANRLLSLPLHPHLTVEDQARVATLIEEGLK